MIVVAGEALIDLVVPHDGAMAAVPGGAPYNVARGCALLGASTALLAAISDDRFGHLLEAGLSAAGVSSMLLQRTGLPTTLAVAELDEHGGASFRFYAAGTSAPSLTAPELPSATDMVVTGGLGLVLEPMATAIESTVFGAPDDVVVVVDVNCRPTIIADQAAYGARLARVLARADVVKVSDEDVAFLRPAVEHEAAAHELLAGGAGVVLVTSGGTATTIVTARSTVSVPVAPVAVVDTIGAGDAFTSGFATWWRGSGRGRAELADPDALTAAVGAAHAVASIVVGRRGADPPRRDELPAGWL